MLSTFVSFDRLRTENLTMVSLGQCRDGKRTRMNGHLRWTGDLRLLGRVLGNALEEMRRRGDKMMRKRW
jgi:hypothetical protein